MTPVAYEALLEQQGGQCAICREKPGRYVDHNHTTGKIRGLLCNACNRGLGLLGDETKRLERAIEYLRSFKPSIPPLAITGTSLKR